jgi:membrane protein implicated in regulation of membrane protease activity
MNFESAIAEIVLVCVSYFLSFSASTQPDYAKYAWVGGVFILIMLSLLFGDAFQLGVIPAIMIGSFFTMLLMVIISLIFSLVMFVLFVILAFIMIAAYEDSRRTEQY